MEKQKAKEQKPKERKRKFPPIEDEEDEDDKDEEEDLKFSSKDRNVLEIGELRISSKNNLKSVKNTAVDLLKNRDVRNYLNVSVPRKKFNFPGIG